MLKRTNLKKCKIVRWPAHWVRTFFIIQRKTRAATTITHLVYTRCRAKNNTNEVLRSCGWCIINVNKIKQQQLNRSSSKSQSNNPMSMSMAFPLFFSGMIVSILYNSDFFFFFAYQRHNSKSCILFSPGFRQQNDKRNNFSVFFSFFWSVQNYIIVYVIGKQRWHT